MNTSLHSWRQSWNSRSHSPSEPQGRDFCGEGTGSLRTSGSTVRFSDMGTPVTEPKWGTVGCPPLRSSKALLLPWPLLLIDLEKLEALF